MYPNGIFSDMCSLSELYLLSPSTTPWNILYIWIYIHYCLWNNANKSKVWRCADHCITNNWLHFQRNGLQISPKWCLLYHLQHHTLLSQCRASKQSGNVKANALSSWTGAISAHEWVQMDQNGWSLGSSFVMLWHFSSYRVWYFDSDVYVWNQWIKEVRTQRRASTVPCNVTTAWDDCHLVCMAVRDRGFM